MVNSHDFNIQQEQHFEKKMNIFNSIFNLEKN